MEWRDYLNGDGVEIIDISPMGCRTGFYMSLLGSPKKKEIIGAWENSMKGYIQEGSKFKEGYFPGVWNYIIQVGWERLIKGIGILL